MAATACEPGGGLFAKGLRDGIGLGKSVAGPKSQG